MKSVEFDLKNGRRNGELVKENSHTVWVKFFAGGKVNIIKRHKINHCVKINN